MNSKIRYASVLGTAFALISGGAAAKDIYVSATGTAPESYDAVYTELQAAIDGAATDDTIWIEDGFVCDTGSTSDKGNSRIYCGKRLTIRSVSGDPELGATVRGAFNSEAEPIGANAVRCAYLNNSSIVVRGLRFECGSTTTGWGSGYGGGVLGVGTLTNCVITGCRAASGGGAMQFGGGSLVLRDCVVSDNYADEGGGLYSATAYSTKIIRNRAKNSAGGVRSCHLTDCLVADNVAETQGCGGGNLYGGSLTRCVVRGNKALGVGNTYAGGGINASLSAKITDCLFFENESYSKGGGLSCDKTVLVSGCVISNNFASVAGGGVNGGYLTDCQIVDNICSNETTWTFGMGGGVSSCTLTNCLIRGNLATGGKNTASAGYGCGGGGHASTLVRCQIVANRSTGRGAGLCECSTYNCVVSCNTNLYGAGGGAAWGKGEHYNTLFEGNYAASGHGGVAGYDGAQNPANVPCLYNCTVVSNVSDGGIGCGGCNGVFAYNTISWGNVDHSTGKEDYYGAARCCFTDKANVRSGSDNISRDPKLGTEGGYDHVPLSGSKAKNCGLVYDWMSDTNDVRSTALNAVPRIKGSGPDLGAFEGEAYGMMIFLR